MPYILENFEIFFGSFHHSWAFTTQIRGGLNQLLSERWKLPSYIYLLFSNDQIEDSEILGDELYKVLNSLFTAVNRSLIDRKLLLPKKARRARPPGVIVVRTVPKSDRKQREKNFKNKRRSLNRAIQKTAQDFNWRSVNIDPILPTDETNFDEYGDELSAEGLRVFWNFLSDELKTLREIAAEKKGIKLISSR